MTAPNRPVQKSVIRSLESSLRMRHFNASRNPGRSTIRMFVLAALVAASVCTSSARAQHVGIGTTTPAVTAILDITAANMGLLIPRMATATKLAIVAPATGLLVYDNTLNTFYYFNGVAWVPFLSSSGSSAGWLLLGNLGTIAGTNFLGTTDLQDLVFSTNSVEGMRLSTAGNLGIGINAPTSILHTVASGAKVANYTGNLLTNIATSSTASITKYGAEVLSTGVWNGATATNIGLHVNATGGTTNYSGIFEGGNVGVNTVTPATYVDVSGDLATRYSAYAASNGVNNNIAIGTSSFVRITGPSAAFSITGITGGVDGKMLVLYNSTAQTFTLTNEGLTSTAANRVTSLNSLGDIVVNGKGAIKLIYSAADSRWLVLSASTTVSASTTGQVIKRIATDETYTLLTTLHNDLYLSVPIPANDSMKIEGYIDAKENTAGKFCKIAFTLPAGASMNIMVLTDNATAVQQDFLKTSGTATAAIDCNPFGTNEQGILFFGTVVTGATAGNVQLQWALNAVGADVLTFVKGSYMKGTLIR